MMHIPYLCLLLLLTSSYVCSYVPEAGKNGDYYEKYVLDYGRKDNKRNAGSLRGLVPSGSISSLRTNDPFIGYLNRYLEQGASGDSNNNRIKPFYAYDFGSKKDLPKGEHPKIIIVNRMIKTDKNGFLMDGNNDVDVEVKIVKNPFWRARCNFAVRYIVPNRENIIKIMQSKGRFKSELIVNSNNYVNKISFQPRWIDHIFRGKRDVQVNRVLMEKSGGAQVRNVTKK